MRYRQILLNNSFAGRVNLFLQPAEAWIAILALVFFSVMCLVIHAGGILRIAFPVGAFAVGAFLYLRYPMLYVGFTWWLWLISPLLARLADYQSGLNEQLRQLIIASPYLVTMLTSVTFFKNLPKAYRQGGLPFVLAFIGVFYSFLVGLIHYRSGGGPLYSPMKIGVALLSWMPSIFFGFHLFMNWRDYPSYRQNIQRTFCWGVLVTGVYGVLQYLVAPEWDRFWLRNAEDLQLCCGWPEPLMIRVWSTLNTPTTFASFMMAGLLLLFSNQNALRIPAAMAGYLAFLLCTVRAAWGGWFVGLLTFITSVKPQFQLRLLITIVVMVLCVYPLTVIEPFSEVISSRLESFSNLEGDTSYNERSELYAKLLDSTISEGLGQGLSGNKVFVDSGLLEILSTLGWFGVIFYLSGIILLFSVLFRYTEVRFDPFMNAARSISLSIFVMLPFSNTMTLLHGMLFWGFSGMVMAAHKYYEHQRIARDRI